jgi:hypothetical protein
MKVKSTEHPMKVFLAVATVLAVACLAPGVAQAAFKRTFLRQITSTPAGALSPLDVAVGSSGDVWIGNLDESGPNEFELNGFGPASAENKFVAGGSFKVGTVPAHFTLESATAGNGDFYVINEATEAIEVYESGGSHAHVETWPISVVQGKGDKALLAVDDSPHENEFEDHSSCGTLPYLNLGECFVYRASAGEVGNGGLEKFNSKGEPEPFSGSAPYISVEHPNKITGIPSDPNKGFVSGSADISGITVDPEGNIYVAFQGSNVYEFAASGLFVREFNLTSGTMPPLVGQNYGSAGAVAFDPESGHLLVTVSTSVDKETFGALDEFDAVTGEFVSQITETTGGKHLEEPVAMSTDSDGDVYVVSDIGESHLADSVEVYSRGAYVPDATLGVTSARTGVAATLNGTVNPDMLVNKAPVTNCYFQYIEEAKYQAALVREGETEAGFPAAQVQTAQCEHPDAVELSSPANEEVHAVHATIENLVPGSTYRYRLLATTSGATGGTAETLPLAFTTPAAPGIVSTSAENLSSTFADLHAQIDPHGVATTYHFEYLTAASYAADGDSFSGPDPATSVPVPDVDIGSGGPTGGASESVMQHLGSLQPGTIYDFRVVAANAQGVSAGSLCEGAPAPACTFATLPAPVAGLPDGRAYELVTPATKEGGSDMFAESSASGNYNNEDVGTPSESGEGFLLEAKSQFGPFPAATDTTYVFHRDPQKGEWAYVSLASPSLGVQSIVQTIFDPADLSRVGVNNLVGSFLSEEGGREESLVGEPGGSYTTAYEDPLFHQIYTAKGSIVEPHERTEMIGASRDLSHVVLESEAPVGQSDRACPGAESVKQGAALCEWAGGELNLVNVKVGGEGEPVSSCGSELGSGSGIGGTHQAVSANGSKVFFAAPQWNAKAGGDLTGPGCWERAANKNTPQVYARIDGTTTLEVSEPEAGLRETGSKEPHERPVSYPAKFVGASEDGSEVFFVTDAWLTANHPLVHDSELYECRITEEMVEEQTVPKCALTRVSAGVKGEPGESEGANVSGVQAVASEGTAVYFLASGILAPGASKPEHGLVNLYRYQPETSTVPAQTKYVAAVSPAGNDQPECPGGVAPCTLENWYTTPDGRYLLFYSEVDLTANAHVGGECEIPGSEGSKGLCGALYRYDAQAAEKHEQSIVCVSCDPNGGVPSGAAEFTRSLTPGPTVGPVRAMSNDGSYVFFDTPTPLVPQATNGTLNVYEWHEGTISLLNSGAEAGPSYFLGSSSYVTPDGETIEGGNVFIGTHDKLVAADTNKVGNIYDVRICVAESPCIQPPPGETALCEGSSCQSTPAEPLDATPTSLTFSGPGDASSETPATKAVTKKAAVKCRKGYEKKKGKCVKKPKKKPRARKSSDKRRAK